MTETMQAIGQDILGGPDVLKAVQLDRPVPGASQVLVRVRAAGVNPTDWKHRSLKIFLGDPPFVLGWEVSGVVEKVGLGVTLWKPGDEVFGILDYPHGVGAHAEFVVTNARNLVRKPDRLDHVEAAGIPVAGLTAWQVLVDIAQVGHGQRVLVHAAGGGVGHLAVQIAKSLGAYVIGTASAGKHDFVRGLGADEVIDYRAVDFAEVVRDIDVAVDTVGGEIGVRSLDVLKPGGLVVSILPPGDELLAAAADRDARAEVMLVEADQAGLRAIASLLEKGELRVHLEHVFPLAEAAKAHALGEAGHVTGKLVLSVS